MCFYTIICVYIYFAEAVGFEPLLRRDRAVLLAIIRRPRFCQRFFSIYIETPPDAQNSVAVRTGLEPVTLRVTV